jgi:hypothetical protein
MLQLRHLHHQQQLDQDLNLSSSCSSNSIRRREVQGMSGDDVTAAWCGRFLTSLKRLNLRGYCLSGKGVIHCLQRDKEVWGGG